MSNRSSLFHDDPFFTPSSQSPFFSPTPNPLHYDQTLELENSLSRLSLSTSPFNYPPLDFAANGPSGVNSTSKIHSCYDCGSFGGFTPQSSNLCSGSYSYPTLGAANNRYSSSYDNGFFCCDPLVRQREFGSVFSVVPVSNGVQQKPPGVCSAANFLNGSLGNKRSNNVAGFGVDERRVRWFNELRRKVVMLAMDQHLCRTLQEALKKLTTEEFSIIFMELTNHVAELMVDPFGNYVIQRTVEICSEEQRTHIILMLTQNNSQLSKICYCPHGTRAVEKLLEHVTTQEQRDLIVSSLTPFAASLAKDINGHRVLLHCLQHFPEEDNRHLLNEVANKCLAISIDKTGCCVLQQCINQAQGETKKRLISCIIQNASLLAEDCYGNYVVQHILSKKILGVTESILAQLKGRFFHLACNKYGSNVVEKFLQDSGEQLSACIIVELLDNPNAAMLVVDPYGNYVIKSALLASSGTIRMALEQLIKQNSMMMLSNRYGKKLLAWFEQGKDKQALH
ncbi:hypothetical protein RJT34_08569 [Clitoria ternatea]|uniref:PUM-HD domain-containing protein n=1 Tax=Clitoria ternatea TaxID=43366 RepID=A0AAN9PUX9_CLITE